MYVIKRQSIARDLAISGLLFITVLLLSPILIPSILIPSITAAKTITSGSDRVAMLELYTSQSCSSSCPPAEDWIGQFKDDPNLWHHIVPINFHVDYWDHLGWKDHYADKVFSKRQRSYKKLSHSRIVATPGFIVNGKGWNGRFYPKNKPHRVGVLSADISALTQHAKVTSIPKRIRNARFKLLPTGYSQYDLMVDSLEPKTHYARSTCYFFELT